jgi:DNA polymerase
MIDLVLPQATCTKCELHQGALTNCVKGQGPETAPVLVVGDYPDSHASTSGVAFTGRTGDLLNEMMADAGFAPSEYRVTYAVRCQPPTGVKPTPSQVEACREHLKQEIQASGAQIIIAMGDVALQALTKKSGISIHRGTSLPLQESFGLDAKIAVWPTYSPSLVQRQGHVRDAVVVPDLRRIRASVVPEEVIPYNSLPDGFLKLTGDLIAFDIETLDAEGNFTDYPTQIAISSREGGTIVTTDVQGAAQALKEAQDRGAMIVGHNSWTFDIPKLREYHVESLGDGMDTMTLAYLDGEQQPLGLEALAVRYLGARGWKDDGRKDAKLGTEQFRQYNARDAWYTLLLAEHLWNKIGSKRQNLAYLLLHTRRALDACSQRGLPIDQNEVARVKQECQEEIMLAEYQVLEACASTVEKMREPRYMPLINGKSLEKWLTSGKPHNPNSADQVALIMMWRGLSLTKNTPTGKRDVSVSVLQQVAHDPYVAALLEYRKATRQSAFTTPTLFCVSRPTGPAHRNPTCRTCRVISSFLSLSKSITRPLSSEQAHGVLANRRSSSVIKLIPIGTRTHGLRNSSCTRSLLPSSNVRLRSLPIFLKSTTAAILR